MIFTERLVLRQWKLAYFRDFARMNADARTMEQMPGTMSFLESVRFYVQIQRHFQRHGFGLYAVATRERKEFIGFVGLMVPGFAASFMPAVEIGWRLLPEYWGAGFATEAAQAVAGYAFRELKLPALVSYTVPGNTASRRVMEKLGMSYDPKDDFEHPGLPAGHRFRPHVLYRLTKAEFVRGRASVQAARA